MYSGPSQGGGFSGRMLAGYEDSKRARQVADPCRILFGDYNEILETLLAPAGIDFAQFAEQGYLKGPDRSNFNILTATDKNGRQFGTPNLKGINCRIRRSGGGGDTILIK
jgi:hypothetical protein